VKLGRFAIVYLGIMVALMVLILLVQAIFRFDISNAGMAIIPAMGAAMVEGQAFAKAQERMPEPAEMWGFARRAGIVILGLTLLSTAAFSLAVPEIKHILSQPQGTMFLLVAVLFQAMISFLLVRFFLATGAKSMLRAQKRP
jgi:cobalamin synthase